MVAHQTGRMAAPVELADHLTEHPKKLLTIHVILVGRLTAITKCRNVIQRTTKFEANGSSHAADLTPPDATTLDLTSGSSTGLLTPYSVMPVFRMGRR